MGTFQLPFLNGIKQDAAMNDRLAKYSRWKRYYDGWLIRENLSSNVQFKRTKYNLVGPIVNIGVDFLAGHPINFSIEGDKEAAKVCEDIWRKSGGTAAFLENALLGSIYGDSCVLVVKKDEDYVLQWMDAAICFPEFDPTDYEKVLSLTIAYRVDYVDGQSCTFVEKWANGSITVMKDDKIISRDSYDHEMFDGVPAVWIRNLAIKGEALGRSDVEPICELVDEYDHLCNKQTQIIDYYASPNIFMKGVRKADTLVRNQRTIYFLPADGDMGFIEWSGTPPSVDTHIDRVREAISELSSTPIIAFGKIDLSSSDVSGLALKMLFGPLLAKTQRKRESWGRQILRALQMALQLQGKDIPLDAMNILWRSPLPADTKEFWETAVMKDLLGISKQQIMREGNYTEDQIEQIQDEKEEEAQQEIELEAERTALTQPQSPDAPTDGSQDPGAIGTEADTKGRKRKSKEVADHKGKPTLDKIAPAATNRSNARQPS